jgi:hypothetical protein
MVVRDLEWYLGEVRMRGYYISEYELVVCGERKF